jgi:hypothetical protein
MFARAILLIMLGSAAAGVAAQAGPTVSLGQIRAQDAMAFRAAVLPADIAARVVAGRIQKVWLPGQTYSAIYREAPRDRGDALCTMAVHSVYLSNTAPAAADAPDGLPFIVENLQSNETMAVRPPWDRGPCSTESGYVVLWPGLQGEYQTAAYRRLLGWIALAREGRDPGVELGCRSEAAEECADPRAALASLPLDALFGIEVRNPRSIELSSQPGVRVLGAAPLTAAEPHAVTASFGMSGENGHSWRVEWVENDGQPPRVQLRRGMVIYH